MEEYIYRIAFYSKFISCIAWNENGEEVNFAAWYTTRLVIVKTVMHYIIIFICLSGGFTVLLSFCGDYKLESAKLAEI